MNGSSVYKIPDGKLVKILLEFDKKKILSVKIFGDFFVYPENGLEKIEITLVGSALDEKIIGCLVEKAKKKHKLDFFGIDSNGVAKAILMASEGTK